MQLNAIEAAYHQTAGRLSEAERSLLIAQDQQAVQHRIISTLHGQVAEGQKALSEVLGRQASSERALLLDSDAARVWTLKEADRQKAEAERTHEKAQREADRQVAEVGKALQKALHRIASFEKQMAQVQEGNKVLSHMQQSIQV